MARHVENPLLSFLDRQRPMILDGGLATTLEDRGFDLNDDLWSARVLLEDPAAVARVHRDFLTAGADCLTTATYQASIPGLVGRGLDPDRARDQLKTAVDLAVDARDDFWSRAGARSGRLKSLVAASVGPYGAYLADGSEYVGEYGISAGELADFHRERLHILARSRADLLACETLPSLREANVLLALLAEIPDRWAWFSFSCRDGAHLSDGTPFTEAVQMCAAHPQVAAVGVNCTAPEHILPLVSAARELTDLPLVVYPNSGEMFDPAGKTWRPGTAGKPLSTSAGAWVAAGADAVGGCCRIGPAGIAALRATLLG